MKSFSLYSYNLDWADGTTLATGSFDGTMKLWDVCASQCFKTLKGNIEIVFAMSFSPDGK
nr:hypothetical protein [Calothrix elsteri]